jgi:hypothetical protein
MGHAWGVSWRRCWKCIPTLNGGNATGAGMGSFSADYLLKLNDGLVENIGREYFDFVETALLAVSCMLRSTACQYRYFCCENLSKSTGLPNGTGTLTND